MFTTDLNSRTSAEKWHLLKASINRLETNICAMKEIQKLTRLGEARQLLRKHVEEGERLIAELRRKMAN